jgi:hypothetical protein
LISFHVHRWIRGFPFSRQRPSEDFEQNNFCAFVFSRVRFWQWSDPRRLLLTGDDGVSTDLFDREFAADSCIPHKSDSPAFRDRVSLEGKLE